MFKEVMLSLNITKEKIKIVIAMLIWGTIGIFVREIDLGSVDIAFFRALIGSIFLFFLGIFKHEKLAGAEFKKNLPILMLSGAIIGVNWVLLFQAYKYTTISNATLSYYLAPVFIVILSSFILKEKLSTKKITYIFIALIGLFLILQTGEKSAISSYNHVKGILFGLSGAVLYAIVVMLNKHIKCLPTFTVTLLQLFVAAIILLPFVISENTFDLKSVDMKSWIIMLLVGIIHTGVAYLLYFSAIKEVKGQSIAILSYIDPIFAVLISFVFLDEPMGVLQILGGLLILGSAYLSEGK
ncbi:DMT family transporter [Proteiniborus ethanoligenes]|nr:EamA family transporter [Proteiniborus ethanoligenes]